MKVKALCILLAIILSGCATKETIPIEKNALQTVVVDTYPEWMTYIAETPELLYTIGEGNSEDEALEKAKLNFSKRIYNAFETLENKYENFSSTDAFTEVMDNLRAVIPETIEIINDSLEIKDSYTNSLKQTWTILQIKRSDIKNILFNAWEKATEGVPLFSSSLVKALADVAAKSAINELF